MEIQHLTAKLGLTSRADDDVDSLHVAGRTVNDEKVADAHADDDCCGSGGDDADDDECSNNHIEND